MYLKNVLIFALAYAATTAFAADTFAAKPGLSEHRTADGQLWYLYVPARVAEGQAPRSILALIHGYSGRLESSSGRKRVKRGIERWTQVADRESTVLIAPQFAESLFGNDYQRLNFRGQRADRRLLEIIDQVRARLPARGPARIKLFGFSGGGQFVHRFAAFHPTRVERAVAGGAGWYMWPDQSLPYPIGTGPGRGYSGGGIDLRKFAGVNLLILVGSEDRDQGSFRKTYGKRDLGVQGATRLERGRNWVGAMQRKARGLGVPLRIQFRAVPGVAHTTGGGLRTAAAKFLFP